jgi:membrane protein
MFERIWGTNRNAQVKHWWGYVRIALYDRLAAFLMLLAVGVALLAVFLSGVVFAAMRARMPVVELVELHAWVVIWDWARVPITVMTNAMLLGVIYRVLPRAPVRWREALAGGLLVSIVWFIGQRLLISFVIGTGYTAYGLVGSFIATMIWLYYVSAVLFFGAEFVQALRPAGEK